MAVQHKEGRQVGRNLAFGNNTEGKGEKLSTIRNDSIDDTGFRVGIGLCRAFASWTRGLIVVVRHRCIPLLFLFLVLI